MGCNIPFEQVNQQWVQGSSALIANRNGTACLALGSQDTAGAVLVTPLQQQGTAIKPILVTAQNPYVGWLVGPLQVDPVAGEVVTAAQSPQIDMLDLMAWEQLPPFKPGRAAYVYSGTPSIAAVYFRVRGRKRISVVAQASAGTITVGAYRVAANGVLHTVDATPAAALTTAVEFVTTYNEAAAGASGHGYSIFDYIIATKSTGTWTALDVQAWDE